MQKSATYIILCLMAIIAIFWKASIHRIKIDGISSEIADIFLPTDTECADGYTDENFMKITIGISEKDVTELLGEPRSKFSNGTKIIDPNNFVLQYCWSPKSTNYRMRSIRLIDGKVAEITGEFFYD